MPLTNGQIFAGYTIIRLLGSGGMGEVYLAQHPRLPRRDALKLLPRDWSADADIRAAYKQVTVLFAEMVIRLGVRSYLKDLSGGRPLTRSWLRLGS
jgi:hypothetical protein